MTRGDRTYTASAVTDDGCDVHVCQLHVCANYVQVRRPALAGVETAFLAGRPLTSRQPLTDGRVSCDMSRCAWIVFVSSREVQVVYVHYVW